MRHPGPVVSGWTIFFALLGAYMVFVVWLVRSGRMEKWNLSLLLGFILMIRTQRGRDALAFTAKPARAWNLFGDLGIVMAYIGMAGMTVLMLALLPTVLSPDSGVEALGASEILVIPGVNPFVPLWYGIAALIITLIVHEGGHGVLALTNKMRVKSLGLLYAIVPVGAFVEPDEDDLMESPRRSRLRVYAAGPAVNIVVALVTLGIFAGMVGAATPVDGVPIAYVVADAPADLAQPDGIRPGDVIVAADGEQLADWAGFLAFMDDKSPGDAVTFTMLAGHSKTVTLGNRWDDQLNDRQRDHILNEGDGWESVCPEDSPSGGACAESLTQDPFLGVQTVSGDVQGVLASPFGNGGYNFLLYVSLPFQEIRGEPYLSAYMPDFHTTSFEESVYWPIATLAFWVSWINLMVGLTNILPMLPLDGGHLFRDGVGGLMERLRPNLDAERRDKIVGRLAGVASFVILGAFLLQIFGPRIAQLFA